MKEVTIKIRKLGLIRDSEVTIKPMMIFSGDSGLGKTYTAVLSNYIFELMTSPVRLNKIFKDHSISLPELPPDEHSEEEDFITIEMTDFVTWINEDAVDYLGYMLNYRAIDADVSVVLPITATKLSYRYSYRDEGISSEEQKKLVIHLNNSLSYTMSDASENVDEESKLAYLTRFYLVQQIMGDFKALRSNYIMPPSRGAILTEDVNGKTGLFIEFINKFKEINTAKAEKPDIPETLMSELTEILEGRVYKEDASYIYETHDDKIPISAAASSIRELAPLTMFLSNINISTAAILMEEPEAHLHPMKQRMMGDVLSMMVSSKAIVQITTHSDYLLKRLNELIALHNLKRDVSEDQYSYLSTKLKVDDWMLLDPNNVNGYYLRRREDGSVEIVKQDTSKKIPFNSFSEALQKNLSAYYTLEEALKELPQDNEDDNQV